MTSGWEKFRYTGRVEASFGQTKRRTQTSTTSTASTRLDTSLFQKTEIGHTQRLRRIHVQLEGTCLVTMTKETVVRM